VNIRPFIAAVALATIAVPAIAATMPPAPTSYKCFDAPAKVNYDAKHDRFYVHYAAERILMTRVPSSSGPATYINRKKNLMWQLINGQGIFSLLMAGSMDVDHKIATCVYKR
jgi:hypothetical protein